MESSVLKILQLSLEKAKRYRRIHHNGQTGSCQIPTHPRGRLQSIEQTSDLPGRSLDFFWCDIAFSIGLSGFNRGIDGTTKRHGPVKFGGRPVSGRCSPIDAHPRY